MHWVCMVKLSEQRLSAQQISRPTRTQRVQAQQEQFREGVRFEQLSEEAKRVQEERLSKAKTIEEYEQEYTKLRPDIKQFFATPQELRQQKTERIIETRSKVETQIQDADRRLIELEQKYQQDKQKAQTISDNRRRNEKLDRLEDSYEEDREYLIGYKQGLQEGLGQLGSKEVDYGAIVSYAQDVGDYRERREEARNQQRKFNQEQKRKEDALIEKGFQPQLIQQYEKGKFKEAGYVFFNPKTGEYVPQSFQKLATDQEIKAGKLSVGGKEFEFKTSDLQARKKAQEDLAIQERTRLSKEPIFLDIGDIAPQVARRETISSQPRTEFLPVSIKTTQTKSPTIIKRATEIYNKIPEDRFTKPFTFPIGTPLGIGVVFKTKEEQEKYLLPKELNLKKTEENLEEQRTNILEKYDTGYKEITEEAQAETNLRFQRAYNEKIIRGEITFEEAVAEFEASDETKIIQAKYEKRLKTDLDLSKVPFVEGRILGVKIAGTQLAKSLYSSISTPKRLIVTGLVLKGAGKGLKLISPKYLIGGEALITGYGTYKFLSPKSTFEQSGAGLITAGLGAGFLSARGLKFLRRPIVTRTPVTIRPTLTAKQQRALVIETGRKGVIDLEGNLLRQRKLKAFQISEQVAQGERTIVTTTSRKLLGLKPIYQGIPQAQRGRKYLVKDLIRGTETTFRTESGYEKALKLITKRQFELRTGLGVTRQTTISAPLKETQARALLRNVAPVRRLSTYEGEITILEGDKLAKPQITIKGRRDIFQVTEEINKQLGLKTRGARPIREVITGTAEPIGEVKQGDLLKATFNIEKAYLTPKGRPYQLISQAGKTTRTQVEEIIIRRKQEEEVFRLGKEIKGLGVYKEYPLEISEQFARITPTLPKGRRFFATTESGFIRRNVPMITKDLREIYERVYSVERIKEAKPISELKTAGQWNKLVKDLAKLYDKKQVAKTIIKARTEPIRTNRLIQTTPQLEIRTGLQPSVPQRSIRDIVKNLIRGSSRFSVAGTEALAVQTSLGVRTTQASRLNQQLKPSLSLINALALSNRLEQQLRPKQAQAQSLKMSQLLKIVDTTPRPISISSPIIRSPEIPAPTRPIGFGFGFDISGLKQAKKRKKNGQTIEEYALLPDFTSRALGLSPQKIKEEDALKEVKKILTGLEIRRGLILQ